MRLLFALVLGAAMTLIVQASMADTQETNHLIERYDETTSGQEKEIIRDQLRHAFKTTDSTKEKDLIREFFRANPTSARIPSITLGAGSAGR